jgi:hypothetical protein
MEHQLAFKHVDELVFALVPVTERRLGVGLDARNVDAELRQSYGIAELLLLAPGNNGGEFLWVRWIVGEGD